MRLSPPRTSWSARQAGWFAAGFAPGVLLLSLALTVFPLMGVGPFLAACAVLGLLALVPVGRYVLVVGFALVAVALVVALLTPALKPALDALIVSEAPHRADAIVVLGGGVHCGSGELGDASLARLTRGLELWRTGYADRLVLSDTPPDLGGSGCPSAGVLQRALVRRLYPSGGPEVVLLERMLTTRTEAVAAATLVKRRGWTGVLLVTSPTHTRRALGVFRRAGLPVTSVASSEVSFDLTLRTPYDRMVALQTLVREYVGLWVYARRRWL